MSEDFHDVSIRVLQNRDRFVYPRATVTGYVIDHASEDDGDYHIKLADTDLGAISRNTAIEDFVICEIIPEIPISPPPLHSYVSISGIYRWDIEHGWPELHPVLRWTYAPTPTTLT